MAETQSKNRTIIFYEEAIRANARRLQEAIDMNAPISVQQQFNQVIVDFQLKLYNLRRSENRVIDDSLRELSSVMPPMPPGRSYDEILTRPGNPAASREHITVPYNFPPPPLPEMDTDPFLGLHSVSKNDRVITANTIKKVGAELSRIFTLISHYDCLLKTDGLQEDVYQATENNIELLDEMAFYLSTRKQELKADPKSYAKLTDPSIEKNLGFLLRARLNHWEKKHQKLDQAEAKIKIEKGNIVLHHPLNPTLIDHKKKKKIEKLDYKLAQIKRKRIKVERKQRIITDKKISKGLHQYRELLYRIEKRATPIENARNALDKNTERKRDLVARVNELSNKRGGLEVGVVKEYEAMKKTIDTDIDKLRQTIEKKSKDFSVGSKIPFKSKFAVRMANRRSFDNVRVAGLVPAAEIAPPIIWSEGMARQP